jgi:nucleoside-diphosphate-sugar epimerase
LYAILKQSFSDVVAWYNSTSLLSTTDLVLFDVYGFGDLRDRIVPRLFAAARTGEELTVNSPDALLNLCHVDDVISAVDLVLRTRTNGRWALRSRSLITVKELARIIESITGRCIVSDWGQKPPHADPSQNKIPTLPGWSPTVELKQKLQDYWKSEVRSE